MKFAVMKFALGKNPLYTYEVLTTKTIQFFLHHATRLKFKTYMGKAPTHGGFSVTRFDYTGA